LLEIKNLNRAEEASTTNGHANEDTGGGVYRSTNLAEPAKTYDYRNALDLMPRFVLKQINERRLLNSTTLNTIANNSLISNQTLISPFYTKSTSDMIENANRELLAKRNHKMSGTNGKMSSNQSDNQSTSSGGKSGGHTLTSYNINNLTMPPNLAQQQASNNPNLQNLFNQSQFTSTNNSSRPLKHANKKS
jgi:hypothetical protein